MKFQIFFLGWKRMLSHFEKSMRWKLFFIKTLATENCLFCYIVQWRKGLEIEQIVHKILCVLLIGNRFYIKKYKITHKTLIFGINSYVVGFWKFHYFFLKVSPLCAMTLLNKIFFGMYLSSRRHLLNGLLPFPFCYNIISRKNSHYTYNYYLLKRRVFREIIFYWKCTYFL